MKKRVLKDGFWASFGQIGSALGVLIGTRLLTEFVSPAIFGEISLGLGISTFLYSLFCAPLLQASLRFYSDAAASGHENNLKSTIKNQLIKSTAITIVLTLIGGGIYSYAFKSSFTLFILLSAIIAVDVARNLETNFLAASRRQAAFATWVTAETWAKPVGAILLIMISSAKAETILLGYLISAIIIFLIFRITVSIDNKINAENQCSKTDFIKEINRYAYPLVPLALISWISSLGDRYIIGGLMGLDQVGIYAAVYGLVSRPFLMIGGIVEQILRPLYFDAIAGNDSKNKKIFQIWLSLTCLACLFGLIVIIFFGDILVKYLLAEKYRSSIDLLIWISLGYSFLAISYVFEKVCYAYKMTKLIVLIQGIGSISSFIIGLPLTYYYGIKGAAIAVPIYFGIQLVTAILVALRVEKHIKICNN